MKEHRYQLRVYYEDTDAGGLVYHSNYLNFMERARTEFLQSIGSDIISLKEQHGLAFLVRNATIDYLQPARLNEELVVKSKVVDLKRVSMYFEQVICPLKNEDDKLVVGKIQVVCVNSKLKPSSMPKSLSEELIK